MPWWQQLMLANLCWSSKALIFLLYNPKYKRESKQESDRDRDRNRKKQREAGMKKQKRTKVGIKGANYSYSKAQIKLADIEKHIWKLATDS